MENAATPTPGHWNINDVYREFRSKLIRGRGTSTAKVPRIIGPAAPA